MPSQVYANCAVGPHQVRFLFQSWASKLFLMLLSSIYFLISVSDMATIFTNRGSNIGVHTTATLEVYPWQVHDPLIDGPCSTSGVYQVVVSCTALSKWCFMSSSHSINIVIHTALGVQQSHLILPPSLHGSEGSFLSAFAPLNDTICGACYACWFWCGHWE